MYVAGLCVGLVAFIAVTAWAAPGSVIVTVPAVYVVGFMVVRRADRRTASSIDANVRQAVARRDRMLGRRA
jgi:UPF0716 family protein affecting phage T7 exclusion